VETADVPLRRKYAKGAESAGQQRFSPLIASSHAGGHWFESSSLHQKVPDFVRNQELFLFMISKVTRHFGVFRLTQTLTQKPRGQESTGEGRMASSVPLRLFFVGYMVWLMTLPMVSAAECFIPSVAWV
jgi:hypothetical protein